MTEEPPQSPSPFGEDDVRAQLAQASDGYEPLPSAVADRLDRALDDLPDLNAPDTTPAHAPPAKAPWWRRRFAMGAAAAILVFAGAGIAAQQLFVPQQNQSDTAESDSQEPLGSQNDTKKQDPGINEAPESDAQSAATTFSGRDYSDGELGEAAAVHDADEKSLDSSLDDLLQDASQRQSCRGAGAGDVGGKVSAVDFGSFKNEPAMIVVVSADGDAVAAVAVGASCGDAGTDVLKSERL